MKDISIDYSQLQGVVVEYGGRFLLAVITLIVGLFIIGRIVHGVKKLFDHRNVDATLRPFILNLISVTLKLVLVISVVTMVGVQMTSIIAIIGAAGFAVGMALSGTLQNFAGGVILLLFKPFKVGDFIEAQGYLGVVSEIQLFNTILKTPDNKVVYLPNGGVSTGNIVNFSKEENRRVDFVFGIGYNDDIDKAKAIIIQLIESDERILKDPVTQVVVSSLGDSSVNITVRVWAKTPDYWGVYFDLTEKVKKNFDKEKVTIPFPQRDVHIYNH